MHRSIIPQRRAEDTAGLHAIANIEHGRVVRNIVLRLCRSWTTSQSIIELGFWYANHVMVYHLDCLLTSADAKIWTPTKKP